MELVDFIHAQNAPPHRAELRDELAKSKGKPPNCTTFVDQVVPGLLTTLELRQGELCLPRVCWVIVVNCLRYTVEEMGESVYILRYTSNSTVCCDGQCEKRLAASLSVMRVHRN